MQAGLKDMRQLSLSRPDGSCSMLECIGLGYCCVHCGSSALEGRQFGVRTNSHYIFYQLSSVGEDILLAGWDCAELQLAAAAIT